MVDRYPQREALPLSHMTMQLLSEATGAIDVKGHSWETADAPSNLPRTTLPTLGKPSAGEGVLRKTNWKGLVARHFPSITVGGSIAYVFTAKWRSLPSCEPRAPVSALEIRGFQEENIGATQEGIGDFSL